jgi:hypothetical protein
VSGFSHWREIPALLPPEYRTGIVQRRSAPASTHHERK